MRNFKLPFQINLSRKYDRINVIDFFKDFNRAKENRNRRVIQLEDELHLELNKFKTYNISTHEVIDLAIRYSLSKREFQKMCAELIHLKKESI